VPKFETSEDLLTHFRSNTFLRNANSSLFAPLGLFAMVITFQPDNLSNCVTIDSRQPVFPTRPENSSSFYNTIDPELRPFDSPELTTATRPSSKLRKMSNFIADYGERGFQVRNVSYTNLRLKFQANGYLLAATSALLSTAKRTAPLRIF
jgi:hypothetical protein